MDIQYISSYLYFAYSLYHFFNLNTDIELYPYWKGNRIFHFCAAYYDRVSGGINYVDQARTLLQ